jgi:hypothetical protein
VVIRYYELVSPTMTEYWKARGPLDDDHQVTFAEPEKIDGYEADNSDLVDEPTIVEYLSNALIVDVKSPSAGHIQTETAGYGSLNVMILFLVNSGWSRVMRTIELD